MATVRVPAIVRRAVLCGAQAPNMVRCDRKRGHGGRHTWEVWARLRELEQVLVRLGCGGVWPPASR